MTDAMWPLMKPTPERVQTSEREALQARIAAAIANARAGRRGAPAIVNVLEVLPEKLRLEVLADAAAVLQVLPPTSPGSEVGPSSGRFEHTWDDLATRLGVTRKSIQNWRARPELTGKLPAARADGRHDVDAWKKAMVDHGLARADEDVETDEDDGRPRSVKDWKMRREELLCRKIERDIAKEDEQLLEEPRLAVAFGQMLTGICAALTHFPGATARFLVGIRDPHIVQERLEAKMNAVLQRLNAAAYVEDCLPQVVEDLEFSPDAERLFAAVAFEQQDRAALLELIAIATREVLRAIGRRGIAETLGEGAQVEGAETTAEGPAPAAAAAEEGRGQKPEAGKPEGSEAAEGNKNTSKRKNKKGKATRAARG